MNTSFVTTACFLRLLITRITPFTFLGGGICLTSLRPNGLPNWLLNWLFNWLLNYDWCAGVDKVAAGLHKIEATEGSNPAEGPETGQTSVGSPSGGIAVSAVEPWTTPMVFPGWDTESQDLDSDASDIRVRL